MIQVISKFLILTFTLISFGVSPTVAEDIKDKKIQQLETLLETYIEQNRELKQRLKKIETVQKNLTPSNTATTPEQPIELNFANPNCEQNPSKCNEKEICSIATTRVIGAQRAWKSGTFQKFVDEAKKRNLSCGVTVAQSRTNELIGKSSVTTGSCEANFNQCAPKELCTLATYKLDGQIKWKKGLRNAWATEAKKQNLSCGVMDLKAKAERNQQEAKEEAKLKAEAEAKRKAEEEVRLTAEAEAKRKAEEEVRLTAEAEAKRKAEEEARLTAEAEAKQKAEEEARLVAEAKRRADQNDSCSGGERVPLSMQACFGFVSAYYWDTDAYRANLYVEVVTPFFPKMQSFDLRCSADKNISNYEDGIEFFKKKVESATDQMSGVSVVLEVNDMVQECLKLTARVIKQ